MELVTVDLVAAECAELFGNQFKVLPSTAEYITRLVNPLVLEAGTYKTVASILIYIQQKYRWIVTHQSTSPLYRKLRDTPAKSILAYLGKSLIGLLLVKASRHYARRFNILPTDNYITPWDIVDTVMFDVDYLVAGSEVHIYNTMVDLALIFGKPINHELVVMINSEKYAMTEEYLTGMLICQHLTQGSYSLTMFDVDLSQEYAAYQYRYTSACQGKRYEVYISHTQYCFNDDLLTGFIFGCAIEKINDKLYWRDLIDSDGMKMTIQL